MKWIAILAVTMFSFHLSAGPEEHKAAQTCYVLDAEQAGEADAEIPLEICLETLNIDVTTHANDISVYSYFQPQLFQGLKVTSLIRQNEDQYTFKASNILLDRWESGCGEGQTVELTISGLTDFLGTGDVTRLEVSVTETTLHDVCHSHPQTTKFIYQAR
jgi:hypothetical protein